MSPTGDMLNGLALLLVAAGLGVYRTTGAVYTAGETGITFKNMPSEPDRLICLTAYGAHSDEPTVTLGNQPVQVKMRGLAGSATDVDDLGDGVFAALHGATDLTFGSVHVVQILRLSSLPLGMDEQERRWLRSDNYSVDVDYPGTPLRPA